MPISDTLKILVAEDEASIASQYELALTERNHNVTLTYDGDQCLEAYYHEMDHQLSGDASPLTPPFDAVILDYRMPRKDGMEVAREILAVQPKQRILFASAYVVETLVESVKNLQQVVELIQKPFELDAFIGLVEDTEIWKGLEKLNANVKEIKDMNPSHREISDLLDGLKRLQKGRTFF